MVAFGLLPSYLKFEQYLENQYRWFITLHEMCILILAPVTLGNKIKMSLNL